MIREIEIIVTRELGAKPTDIKRMPNGTCNEVYTVHVNGSPHVLRLNAEAKWLKGSSKYIPLFQSLGIAVPRITAENFSKDSLNRSGSRP